MDINSKFASVTDSFKNLVANLGTSRDKQSAGEYYLTTLTDDVLSTIYRTSWMGRKTVDIPANDATRKWREWNAEGDQIEKIEKEEKRHKLQQKVRKALQLARLFGGSAIYFSVNGDDPEEELDLNSVKAGSLDFVTVLDKTVLTTGDLDQDPMSEYYGRPTYYEVSSGEGLVQRIHPSRVAIFMGNEPLTDSALSVVDHGWGDSVLQSAYEAVRNADAVASNTASLVYEAKVDVLQIPDLAEIMANPRSRQLLEERVILSATLKGNNGVYIIDGDEDYQQKTYSFGGLPEIGYQALQAVSGAADIPLTRFLGQSPAGLSSTGESDLRNYYDSVNSMQVLVVTPTLENLDEVLIRSALGDRPDEINYEWSALWQMTDEQKSNISKTVAETIKALADSGLFYEEDLANAAENVIVKHSILPSFEITQAPEEEEPEPVAPAIVAPVEPPKEDE
jgi:phage-related protein (TIGR01555 family)